jgi:hypothetical protein
MMIIYGIALLFCGGMLGYHWASHRAMSAVRNERRITMTINGNEIACRLVPCAEYNAIIAVMDSLNDLLEETADVAVARNNVLIYLNKYIEAVKSTDAQMKDGE